MTDKSGVGFIGLGLMGKSMARNLIKAGFAVTVHNRSRPAVVELASEAAAAADSPAEVARASQFVITCLPGPADVEKVYLGPDGVLDGVSAGSVLIEMSTIDPGTHQRIAASAAERGAGYLDAPVSGGPQGAREGNLTIMVGGEAQTYDRAQPVLQAMGQRIYHLGPVGAGAVTKLINNMLAGVNLAGVVEGMVLGVKAGLDPQQLFDVISNSSGASRVFASGVPAMLQRDFEPGFAIDLMYKDVALAVDLGRILGVRLLAGALAREVLQEARGAGHGKKSAVAVVLPLEQNTGVEVVKRE